MQNKQNFPKNSSLHQSNTLNVGVWQPKGKNGAWEFVWQNAQGTPEYLTLFPKDGSLNVNDLHCAIDESLNHHGKRPTLRMITAALPAMLSQKTLILPAHTQRHAAREHCEMALKAQLPVSLDQVWFDYMLTPLADNQGSRLDIFAILKEIARNYVQDFAPLSLHVLESVSNVLQYAGRFLAPTAKGNLLYLYQRDHLGLAIAPQSLHTAIFQTESHNAADLYAKFYEKFQPSEKPSDKENHIQPIDQVILLQDPQSTNQLSNALVVKSPVPVLALGCALWPED